MERSLRKQAQGVPDAETDSLQSYKVGLTRQLDGFLQTIVSSAQLAVIIIEGGALQPQEAVTMQHPHAVTRNMQNWQRCSQEERRT